LEAGPVAGGERRGLVEEEEFRIAVRHHHRRAMSALELEHAGDPLPRRPAPRAQRPVGAMERAAAVAEHEPPVWGGDDVALRRDRVLEGHRAICHTGPAHVSPNGARDGSGGKSMAEAAVKVKVEDRRDGRVARVTVDNAAKLNCLSTPLIVELTEAFAELG